MLKQFKKLSLIDQGQRWAWTGRDKRCRYRWKENILFSDLKRDDLLKQKSALLISLVLFEMFSFLLDSQTCYN